MIEICQFHTVNCKLERSYTDTMSSVFKSKRDCNKITKSETGISGMKVHFATYLKCMEDFCLDIFKRLLEILMRISEKV